jgi:hypothetical protein
VDQESAFAYRARNTRGWLDVAEAAQLQLLLAAYGERHESFGARVRIALNKCENATHEPFI